MANFKAVLEGSSAAWADDVEAEESTRGTPLVNQSEFPSLGEAAKKPPPKKKAQKMSLTDFMSGGAGSGQVFADKALNDKAILAALPTASRGVRDEGPAPLGGGFRDYGGDREGGRGFRRDDDRPRRGDREEDMGPSRADQASDWGSTRKFVADAGPSRGFGGGGFGGPREPREPRDFRTAADEVDSWGSTRKFEPSTGPSGRGGFRDDDRRGPMEPSRADQEDQWSRGREFKPAAGSTSPSSSRPPRMSGGDASAADREDRWSRKPVPADEPAATSAAAPAGERPRLKLQPRTAPVADAAPAAGGSKGSNPFGAARPREEVLREKGVDPIKEQLKYEHGDVKRDETPEEKSLKEEVESLRQQLEALQADADASADSKQDLSKQLDDKEKQLYKLQAELDDKVRFKKQQDAREHSRERPNDGPAPPAKPGRW